MAVAHNNSGTLDDGDAITPAAGSDRLLLHGHGAFDDGVRSISTYDLGAATMTAPVSGYGYPITVTPGANTLHGAHAYLVDADIPGISSTLDCAYEEAMTFEPGGDVFEFTGVDQTTPIAPSSDHTVFEGTYASGAGPQPPDMDLDVNDGDVVVFLLYGGEMDLGLTVGGDWAGTMVSDARDFGGVFVWSGYDLITSDNTNYDLQLTKTDDNAGVVQAFVIRQAAAGGGAPLFVHHLNQMQGN